jgi:uncharacterized protein (TIGR00159 family)
MLFDILFPFKWHDIIDILVISLIVHRLFLLFRGTTAFQIILGLLFLWLLQALAHAAGLVLTSWFFQGLGAVAVLVIVVIFRNEIREILIQTNPVRLFLGRPYGYGPPKINAAMIVQTAFRLASGKTGALMVLQNQDRLENYLQEGILLDAKFTPQIIESIFTTQSPVHDGAAIIHGNRIAKVGTFLPLTQQTGLPQRFGTRHRAAIGITEVSYAVVIVVSEERGEVSLVHKGSVKSVKEPQQLTTMLTGLLSKDYTESEPQKKGLAIRSHIGGLFLTFFIVLVSWSIYSGRQLSLINISTPIVYRNIPDNLELIKTSAEQVEVQITGRRHLVSALKKEQVGAVIDLKDKTGGSYELILTPDNINLPLGLDVVRITPSTLSMVFEQQMVKKLSVKPRFTGLVPSGYRIKNISVKPEFVNVNGSVTVLRDMNSLFTETIDLDKLKSQNGEKTVDVPIIISPPSLHLVSGQDQIAKVSISLNSQEVDSEKPQPSTTSLYHRVTEGETLWDISQRYNVPVDRIRYLNKISLSETIYPDQMLIINP